MKNTKNVVSNASRLCPFSIWVSRKLVSKIFERLSPRNAKICIKVHLINSVLYVTQKNDICLIFAIADDFKHSSQFFSNHSILPINKHN